MTHNETGWADRMAARVAMRLLLEQKLDELPENFSNGLCSALSRGAQNQGNGKGSEWGTKIPTRPRNSGIAL